MTQFLTVHPANPQPRLIAQAAACLAKGGVIVYPTDSCYALGCQIGNKSAVERLRQLRLLDAKHQLTLLCADLSAIAIYASVDNSAYRLLRSLTPGPYTFILRASREVPRRLLHAKRKTVGIRVPDNIIAQALVAALGEPILTTSLIMPGDELPLIDPIDINERIGSRVDMIIDGGACGVQETTVIDLEDGVPQVVREGLGDVSMFSGQ